MMPVVLNIASYGKSSAEELPKGTERFIYVLKGKCKTYIGSQEYILKKGETLYFDGSLRHYFKNIGGQEFRAISIFSPPAL
jgi:quercetin dioxygenase-like cupin family protein